eukprot:CAMPEP_0181443772 /NCGR_PEP_ID=MMETSP1110-20121109/24724_1 /TAXON_ID=174948 /ORGANISM="Symbiodinium sp., Strain CCMP421" /LENGTH=100 /DNA_ID=CAMNT_0023567755 /DNA_START=51 /DNA_END=353 /DNA_ORIENTATION=-
MAWLENLKCCAAFLCQASIPGAAAREHALKAQCNGCGVTLSAADGKSCDSCKRLDQALSSVLYGQKKDPVAHMAVDQCILEMHKTGLAVVPRLCAAFAGA